ncbi:carbohydrate kinase family protein [Micromonospora deserti]|uniref:Carbohydrate kinase n=1 Tax=Micromonospora deserti TaxID=2070366 RepID=A0A2W2DA16_9ACTN|nr:carbohydrate kinase [Micromonospora deserti]PZG00759.1 carbohydrate kinase [Micromonospora deserti]
MITVVGETLVDLIEESPEKVAACPGGSPANVAVALARLGQSTTLLTQLGDDPHGRMLRANLDANGVRLDPGSVLDLPRTSVARTVLTPDGQAGYDFSIEWNAFGGAAIAAGPGGECLHTGSLAAVLAPGADDVLTLVRRSRAATMVSFDPNCRPSLMGDPAAARARIETLVALSDVVKVSVEDLAWLCPGLRPEEAGRRWLELGATLVVVTRGARGAWAATRQRHVDVGAYPVEVVDTIGAGDSFTAGMLAALAEAGLLGAAGRAALAAADHVTLTAVVGQAARAAAWTCTRRGADPPSRAELDAHRGPVPGEGRPQPSGAR